jgi:hypothetical protein
MLGTAIGPWCSMFFHILIWPPSCENLFSTIPLISAELIGNGLPNWQCAAHMSVHNTLVQLTIFHQCIGAANAERKNLKFLVRSVSFSSPVGATGDVALMYWCGELSSHSTVFISIKPIKHAACCQFAGHRLLL